MGIQARCIVVGTAAARLVSRGVAGPSLARPVRSALSAGVQGSSAKLLRTVAGCNPGTTDEDLRKALLKFIADFANWDLASNHTYVDVSRALVRRHTRKGHPL